MSHLEAPYVRGFHGTNTSAATAILVDGYRISRNQYDWLGDGVYFFQDAPYRAWEWARMHHGDDAAVLSSIISLENCLNLLDTRAFSLISDVYDAYLERLKREGLTLPRQTAGAHRLDREVINYAVDVLEAAGEKICSVRAAFSEGAPVFPGSALFNRSHVQVAVRDLSVIIETLPMEPDKEGP